MHGKGYPFFRWHVHILENILIFYMKIVKKKKEEKMDT